MAHDLRVFFALESVSETYGGPIKSVASLQDMFHEENLNVSIIQASMAVSLIDPCHVLKNVMTFWACLPELIGRIIKGKKSLIIFNNQWSFGVQILAVFCCFFRIPYIWWVRGVPTYQRSLKKWVVWHFSQKWLMAHARTIVCSSPKSVDRIKSQLSKTDINIIDVPNIIEFPETVCPERKSKETHVDVTRLNLLTVGRFHKSKRMLELVENCPAQINGKHVRLTLAGYANDGDYIDLIRASAKQKNHDILIEENVSTERLCKIHEEADIFVSLSDIENFGNAIADALAFGLPVVINDETDFWPSQKCPGVYACSDKTLTKALELAVAYHETFSLSERKNGFETYWRDFSLDKYNQLLTLCLSFAE